MADDDKTSVGSADPDAKASAGGANAGGKTLDQLLSEWDAGESDSGGSRASSADEGSKSSSADVAKLMERLDSLERERAESQLQRDREQVFSQVKGDLEVDDFLVRAWVEEKASQDRRLEKVWEQRFDNPTKFKSTIAAMREEFEGFASAKLASARRADNRRAASALAGSRETSSAAGDLDNIAWGSLSDNQFAAKKSEVFRAVQQGKLR